MKMQEKCQERKDNLQIVRDRGNNIKREPVDGRIAPQNCRMKKARDVSYGQKTLGSLILKAQRGNGSTACD